MSRPRFITNITKDSFFLIHGCPQDFLLAKWCNIPLVYAVWSSLCSIYTLSMVVYTGLESEHGIKIVIWLTYWSFYAVTLRFTITACNCWVYILCDRKNSKANPPFKSLEADATDSNHRDLSSDDHVPDSSKTSGLSKDASEENHVVALTEEQADKSGVKLSIKRNGQDQPNGLPVCLTCQWFLQNISNAVSVIVTVLFWAIVYTGEHQNYSSINSHVMNTLLVTGDIMISRAPIRIQHFHIPLTYLGIYIGFTLVYWAAGGTNNKGEIFIYSVLDYSNHPKTAAFAICLIALLGVLLTQTFLYFLCRLRNVLYTWRRMGSFSVSEQ